ncbi:hypothetical protein RIF29_09273 [Crotalaria pallida]|uniref:Pectinesterase inhibitor domain-containing protein n=1 Tax=Crotalaria pallida TaxID=3830 RepID=A0AAN9FZD9_CROPI
MNSSKFSFFLFTLSVILISHYPIPALGESLYESICKETIDTDIGTVSSCIQLLKEDPRIPSAKNYLELSKFILEFGVKKGKEGQNYMKKIAKAHPTEAVKLCANSYYDYAIGSFQSAILELKEDILTATYDAKVAGDGPAYCADILAEIKIENPLINKEVSLISVVAFLSTNHLLKA